MKRISLNILLSYPVFWDEYKVLRDFVQNFYDTKGHARWWDDFTYTYEDGKLTMIMKDSTFSYEWLLHIGASSKTKGNGSAGFFGEGFKIASLCAVRDWKWNVSMSSGNWKLHVVKELINIDGIENQALAYEIMYGIESRESMLVLEGMSELQFDIFKGVLKSFYYPENPLLAQKLYEDDQVAVYSRSDMPLPEWLPITLEHGSSGIVFGRFQALGTVPFPYAVALHSYHQKDRERNALYDFQVIELIYEVVHRIDAQTAKALLVSMRRYWTACPNKNIDIHTWYYVVCELIRRMATSEEVCQKFREEYKTLLYGERLLNNDVHLSNRRRMAKAWMQTQEKNYIMVQGSFKLLGIPELETICEEAGGFAGNDEPSASELVYIEILKEVTDMIMGSFFLDCKQIRYKIIRNNEAAWSGKAELIKRKKAIFNNYGLKIKDKISTISIMEKYLTKESFEKALSIYLHEMSHMFGGDSTKGFSLALTYVNELLLMHTDIVEHYKGKWCEVCF